MKATFLVLILASSLLIVAIAEEGRFLRRLKNSRGVKGQKRDNGKPSETKQAQKAVAQGDDASKEQKTIIVSEPSQSSSVNFEGVLDYFEVDGDSWSAGVNTPVAVVEEISTLVSKATLVSSILTTALSALLFPLQITDVILSIIAISMAIAYSIGVDRMGFARTEPEETSDVNILPEFNQELVLSPNLTPPGFIKISQVKNSLSKSKGDKPTVWNTVFENGRSFSSSPFLQDLSSIVLNALQKYA